MDGEAFAALVKEVAELKELLAAEKTERDDARKAAEAAKPTRMTRAQFEQVPAAKRMGIIRGGCALVD